MSEELDDFTREYIRTALWASIDDNEPMDIYGVDDLPPSTVRAMRAECDDFRDLLSREGIDVSGHSPGRIAHDFWLTRNHHGAGFWDGDYPEPLASLLTKWAHSYGTADLYVGDDGLVYQMGSENA